MKNRTLFFASLALTTLSLGAHADKIPMRSIEDAVEASSASVTLPASNAGTLFFRNCSSCNVEPLRLSDNTKFYLGSAEVSFAALKSSIENAKMTQFTIFHTPGGRNVTRIVVAGAAR